MARHVFLTGPPGVGKTTLIQKVSEVLKSSGVPVDGFYTEEVRQGGRRIGFDVVTLSGTRGPLSRIGSELPPGKRECCVGQYVVDLTSFEQLVLPVLRNLKEIFYKMRKLRHRIESNLPNDKQLISSGTGRSQRWPGAERVCHRRGGEDGALQSAVHPGRSPGAVHPGDCRPWHHPSTQRKTAGPRGRDKNPKRH
ncbi:cancer-related nucleoside-triphosphatase isoform X1 [Sagmatias obliquidens]|uniref:cancer-related nucleoside-triphosphatase isoform X1 n=1 Tax=Sagmatias obliquidens TaxID=3371155 RepID=UPI000F43FC6D|nr:cancer-related nucleoside-triphosphatase isoform X1 [Lagenorhynchus obliquidens]XP_026949931.1 cancer-related nucleoside-triphosphatase isoform X1 [Lagenorhynchus obliquidens]